MEALFLLIPLSVVFIGLIGAILYWAIQSGQYDDLEKPGNEILLDDEDDGVDEGRKGKGPEAPDQS